MKHLAYLAALLSLVFGVVNSSYAGNYQIIKLHVSAAPNAEHYIQNVCITTSNGFFKSCGNNAERSYRVGKKNLSLVYSNLPETSGYDDSCVQLRTGMKTPAESGVLDVFTTVQSDIINHRKIVSITNCYTVWNSK